MAANWKTIKVVYELSVHEDADAEQVAQDTFERLCDLYDAPYYGEPMLAARDGDLAANALPKMSARRRPTSGVGLVRSAADRPAPTPPWRVS